MRDSSQLHAASSHRRTPSAYRSGFIDVPPARLPHGLTTAIVSFANTLPNVEPTSATTIVVSSATPVTSPLELPMAVSCTPAPDFDGRLLQCDGDGAERSPTREEGEPEGFALLHGE